MLHRAANGGTSQFADNGQIYSELFEYNYRDTCTGTQHIHWHVDEEFAYTKFVNNGLRNGGNCQSTMFGILCTWNVLPICTNTATPDYRYPGGPIPNAWIRDYSFPAWNSVGACTRVEFGNGTHTPWLCNNTILATLGTGNPTPSNVCTYNP